MSTPERDPTEVIDRMLAQIPVDEQAMCALLEHIKDCAPYRPPEDQTMTWAEIASACHRHLPYPPETKWQREVYRIVTTKEPPRAKEPA